jgi:hypothetical protein
VRMRAALPFLLAAVVGVASAALVACGSGGGDRSDLIPQRSASRLKSALSDVESAVDAGNCDAAERAVARARGVLVNLPRAVDDRLVARLREGVDNLQQIAPDECRQQETTETTTQTTTPTATTPTDTTPTDTTPTDTTPTDTTPTDTTPTTTGTTTAPPPPTTTTPPASGDTTGGTTTP